MNIFTFCNIQTDCHSKVWVNTSFLIFLKVVESLFQLNTVNCCKWWQQNVQHYFSLHCVTWSHESLIF